MSGRIEKDVKPLQKKIKVGALQEDEAGTEDGGQDSDEADGGGSEAELERLEARGGTGGAGAGGSRAAASSSGDLTRALGGSAGGLGAGVLATLAGETNTLAGTLGQVLLGGGGHGRERVGVDIPVGLLHLGAAGGTAGGVVAAVAGGVLGALEGGLESIVVLVGGDLVTADLDQTVLVASLGVLVDETAGVDGGHLGGVEGLDLLELAGVDVATVLGEEEGETVTGEVLNLLVPAGGGEGRGVAPGVVVEGEEVTALIIGTAVHVLGHLETVGVDISGRVTDGDLTELASAEVSTHVTGDGLDVRSGLGGGTVVDDLVTGEEGQGVVVLGELLHGGEDVLEVDIVVGHLGLGTVDGVLGGVDIENKVDAGLSEGSHALIVVLGVIDRVHTDGVQAQFLEVLDVTLATIGISNRIAEVGRTTGLVVDTTHVEAVAALEEGVTLDSDGGDIAGAGLDVGCGTEDGRGAQGNGRGHGGYGRLHCENK